MSSKQAELYEATTSQQYIFGQKLMKLLPIEKGNKVLDFGRGTGYLTKKLADLVGPEGRVIGVDPDDERIKLATEKYSTKNLEYVIGSYESIQGDYDFLYLVILCCIGLKIKTLYFSTFNRV